MKYFVFNFFGVLFFVLDRLAKFYFLKNPGVIRDFKILTLQFWQNQKLAFSLDFLPNNNQTVIAVLTAVIILFLAYVIIQEYRSRKYLEAFFLTTITLGAISNLIDRLAYGGVIDYINFNFWPVFNIADMLIVFGAAGYCYKQFDIKKRTSN